MIAIVQDNVLHKEFTWAGTDKKKNFQANEVILDLMFKITRKKDPNFTKEEFYSSVKAWIRHSGDREKRAKDFKSKVQSSSL